MSDNENGYPTFNFSYAEIDRYKVICPKCSKLHYLIRYGVPDMWTKLKCDKCENKFDIDWSETKGDD